VVEKYLKIETKMVDDAKQSFRRSFDQISASAKNPVQGHLAPGARCERKKFWLNRHSRSISGAAKPTGQEREGKERKQA
jgi:hypothetical protein